MGGVIRTFQDWPQDHTAAVNRDLTCWVEVHQNLRSHLLFISVFYYASLQNVTACCALYDLCSFRKLFSSTVCGCTKFCIELGKNAIKIFQMLQKQNKFSLWKSPSSPHPKKTRDVRFSLICMLIFFYNMHRTVHNKLILQG